MTPPDTAGTWSSRRERGSAWLMRLMIGLAHIVGRRACQPVLGAISLYFLLTDAVARRASREFLAAVRGRPVAWTDVLAHLHAFAVTLLDRVFFARSDFSRVQIHLHGEHLVRQALAAGRGCVLLGSHLGSFDLLMLANQALEKHPVNVLMHRDPRARLRGLAGIDDERHKVIALGRPDSLLRAYEALERGEIVAALADRVEGRSACLKASFLGHTASFPIGPYVLAARARAPILMCFGLYEGHGRYRIEFVDFGAVEAAHSRGAALLPLVDRYAALLEHYARNHPRNWFNFYSYWGSR